MAAANFNGDTLFVCIKQFNARLGDELSLKVGDKVEVLADDSEYNDGWYMGKNLSNNQVGLYPKSFTQVSSKGKGGGGLLRSRSRRIISNASSTPGTPQANVNSIKDSFDNLTVSDSSKQVSKTMNDIDRALMELRDESNSMSTTNLSVPEGNKQTAQHSRTSSAQSLTEDLNPLKAREWTPQQVSSYFALVLGFDLEIAGKFARHKITGDILLELDLAHLKELEIDSFGTRFEIHKEIGKLREASNRAQGNKNKNLYKSKSSLATEPSNGSLASYKNKPIPSTPQDSSSQNTDNLKDETPSKLMPSASFYDVTEKKKRTHQRKKSQSMDDLTKSSTYGTASDSNNATRGTSEAPLNTMNRDYKFGENGNDPKKRQSAFFSSSSQYTGLFDAPYVAPEDNPTRPSSSVYEQSVASHKRNASQASSNQNHARNSSMASDNFKHSSMFSFLTGPFDESMILDEMSSNKRQSQNQGLQKEEESEKKETKTKLTSPAKLKRESSFLLGRKKNKSNTDLTNENYENNDGTPKKSKSISYKFDGSTNGSDADAREEKRSASDSTAVSRLKNLRTTSTQNIRNITQSKKSKTSAFQEGIREVTPDEAIKSANHSGWMSKKSGNTLGWRSRYFTLHGTRLSYFASLRDKKEKGLIDITAHKVIPINTENNPNNNDKYIALYAASTGFGRYCFKLVPPAPGFKKGLTFTQPKTHYFAVESPEEMRSWLKALMTATIDIDDSVPVVSSCSTPTVSLSKAQELLAKAREDTKRKQAEMDEKGYIKEGYDDYYMPYSNDSIDAQTSDDSIASPNMESIDNTTLSSQHPKLSIDTSLKSHKNPSTPLHSASQGFTSPYLLASGILSPKSGHSNGTSSSVVDTPASVSRSNLESLNGGSASNSPVATSFTNIANTSETTPKSVVSHSIGRIPSGPKKNSEKMLAYSSDGSGNHTFVIKSKKN